MIFYREFRIIYLDFSQFAVYISQTNSPINTVWIISLFNYSSLSLPSIIPSKCCCAVAATTVRTFFYVQSSLAVSELLITQPRHLAAALLTVSPPLLRFPSPFIPSPSASDLSIVDHVSIPRQSQTRNRPFLEAPFSLMPAG